VSSAAIRGAAAKPNISTAPRIVCLVMTFLRYEEVIRKRGASAAALIRMTSAQQEVSSAEEHEQRGEDR
jgi:hypothetical protein